MAENTISTLNGNFKEVYSDKLENLTPKGIKFMKDIPFVPREQQPGNSFHQPVLLAHEQGFSYAAGTSSTVTGDFGTLKDAVAGVTSDATVIGAQILLRSRMGYEAAARASSGGTRAFRRAVDIVVENMWESAKKRCEISTLYGQSGIGDIDDGESDNNSLVITKASYAPGIWMGMKGAVVRVYKANGSCIASDGSLGTVSAVVENADGTATVTLSGQVGYSPAAGDVVYFEGTRAIADTSGSNDHYDQLGIHGILTEAGTGNGTISAATYPLWKGTEHAAGASATTLTLGIINAALAKAVGKGLDEDVDCYVNPNVWNDLQADEITSRRFTSQPKRGSYQVGSEGLEYYSQSGKITIKSSIYVKRGFAYLLPTRLWKRVGATDLTFNLPDRGDEFFLHVNDAAAYELRCYSNQAVFTKAPAKSCVITNIL